MRHEKFKGDYVKISSFIFLDKYKRNGCGADATGVLYNKYMTLLNNKLMNELNVDINLPHCWYRWGDIVVKHHLPYLTWTHSDLNVTSVIFNGDEPIINEDDPVVVYASNYAEQFIDDYGSGVEGVESAVDDVYVNAPYEFQNKYRVLREALKLSKKNAPYGNIDSYILTLFEDAMGSFPPAFKLIGAQKTEFIEVFRESIKCKAHRDDLFELVEDFWFFFCYYLRIKCNTNIRRETLDMWREKLPMENSRYEASIQNYAYQLCGGSNNATIIELLARRKERLSELEKILSGLERFFAKSCKSFPRYERLA